MKLISALFVVLILATGSAFGQAEPNATSPNNGPATDQAAPSGATGETQNASAQPSSPYDKSSKIRGCLEAGTEHSYSVTDKNGMRYTLTGMDASALGSHVGEEVEATGELTAGNNEPAGPGSATDKPAASPSQMLKASDVRKVSDKCLM